jgi:hypothetical protein
MLRGVAVCLYGADPNTKTQVLKHQPHEEPTMDPKDKLKQFTEKFEAELANKYFMDDLTLEEATAKFCDVLQERLAACQKLAAEKDAKIAELQKELAKAKEQASDDDDDDEEDDPPEDDDKKEKKDKNKQSAKVAKYKRQLAEKQAELESWKKEWSEKHGGLSYDDLANPQKGDGTGANPSDQNKEYAAELKGALTKGDE